MHMALEKKEVIKRKVDDIPWENMTYEAHELAQLLSHFSRVQRFGT